MVGCYIIVIWRPVGRFLWVSAIEVHLRHESRRWHDLVHSVFVRDLGTVIIFQLGALLLIRLRPLWRLRNGRCLILFKQIDHTRVNGRVCSVLFEYVQLCRFYEALKVLTLEVWVSWAFSVRHLLNWTWGQMVCYSLLLFWNLRFHIDFRTILK